MDTTPCAIPVPIARNEIGRIACWTHVIRVSGTADYGGSWITFDKWVRTTGRCIIII
jgi:hypothetical protein